MQGQKQDLFQPKAERVRPNDPEAVGLGERSTQDPEMVLNTSTISSPIYRNITPTQTEHNVGTPEHNLKSDKLWLKISQFAVQIQEQLDDFKGLNEILQRNAILQEATIQAIQESWAQLSKASEETNKRLNKLFEEQNHGKKDRKKTCHNCGSTDHYATNYPKAKKEVYVIEQVPEEESPTENSESDSMGDAIREKSDVEQDPREEFLVEYQEETQIEIQDIQLEAGMPQHTEKKNLCKNTQDAQKFQVTPTKGVAFIHGTASKINFCIHNAQHKLIIDSGANCSIVSRTDLDHHLPNLDKQLLQTK
ncbi:hypothetical protein O181_042885 [Austropuccinia psidii MF-1]|uniref:Uncharacterized protein n=1 Tax=Austropuccinia psidii MF-1 TaxID=1389203 RepID=A0A9Q3HIL8_9BASI|nr:hypothetical protein [Austropuccinia psidii MF-1]